MKMALRIVLVCLQGMCWLLWKNLRVTATNLETLLARYRIGETVMLHAFRRDELMTFSVKLAADDVPQMALAVQGKMVAADNLRKIVVRRNHNCKKIVGWGERVLRTPTFLRATFRVRVFNV